MIEVQVPTMSSNGTKVGVAKVLILVSVKDLISALRLLGLVKFYKKFF